MTAMHPKGPATGSPLRMHGSKKPYRPARQSLVSAWLLSGRAHTQKGEKVILYEKN